MQRYAITNGMASGDRVEKVAQQCAELARDGVDLILIREKQLAAGDLARLSRAILAAVRQAGSHTRVLIAQRVDVALVVGADGVHLSARPGELTPAQVRRLMPHAFVSVSCHSLQEVTRAREEQASAILFGPVFGKTIVGAEVVPGIGFAQLQKACALAGTMPVFALGGVTQGNAAACIQAGAAGVAGIRMFQ